MSPPLNTPRIMIMLQSDFKELIKFKIHNFINYFFRRTPYLTFDLQANLHQFRVSKCIKTSLSKIKTLDYQ